MTWTLDSLGVYVEAIKWMREGVSVFPCRPRKKTPECAWKVYQTRQTTELEIMNWFLNGDRSFNLAVVTGGQKNLVVLDFDSLDAFQTWWQLYPIESYMVATARGVHVYLHVKESVKACHLAGLGDIKANGGYVLAAPSTHPSGAVYSVFMDAPILTVESLKDVLPPELLEAPANPGLSYEWDLARIRAKQAQLGQVDIWADVESPPSKSNGRDLVSLIRARFQLLDLFDDTRPSGKGFYMARCPFHDDGRPSMWIDSNRGICGCYAGCLSKPADVINLWSQLHHMTNTEAINDLASLLS